MKHVLTISYGLLAICIALIDVAGPSRSPQVVVSSVGALMGLMGIGCVIFKKPKGGFDAVRVFECLLFGVAVVLGLLIVAETTRLF